MVDNDNVVRIETKNESAKRLILNEIQENLGFAMFFEGKKMQLQGPISNSMISNIVNKLIMENMWNNVSIEPVIEDVGTNGKIRKKKATMKEKIFSIFKLRRQVTNAEILDELEISAASLCSNIKKLVEEGKVEKVSRGCWRIIEAEEEVYKKSTTEDIEI